MTGESLAGQSVSPDRTRGSRVVLRLANDKPERLSGSKSITVGNLQPTKAVDPLKQFVGHDLIDIGDSCHDSGANELIESVFARP